MLEKFVAADEIAHLLRGGVFGRDIAVVREEGGLVLVSVEKGADADLDGGIVGVFPVVMAEMRSEDQAESRRVLGQKLAKAMRKKRRRRWRDDRARCPSKQSHNRR